MAETSNVPFPERLVVRRQLGSKGDPEDYFLSMRGEGILMVTDDREYVLAEVNDRNRHERNLLLKALREIQDALIGVDLKGIAAAALRQLDQNDG